MLRYTLDELIRRFVRSEIPCAIDTSACFRIQVKVGDVANGFDASEFVESVEEATNWLYRKALEHFPESDFAEGERLRYDGGNVPPVPALGVEVGTPVK